MAFKQIIIWNYKGELARGKETDEFQTMVNKALKELGDKVEKVYTIGVGHQMVVTAVLNEEISEEK